MKRTKASRVRYGGISALVTVMILAALVAVNVVFVPRVGYMACAWGGLVGYGVCVLLSYFIGQKKYYVPYPVWTILGYMALALVLFFVTTRVALLDSLWLRLVLNTLVLLVYVAVVAWNERAVFRPVVKKILKR